MSNTVWANVELSNGTVQGIGPLELLSFSHTKRLDRAGRFRLPFPALWVAPT